jgi:hypothetical protein
MWSHDAVHKFQDNSIDFIYLDANHSYGAALRDLTIWYPKLRPQGWFCGHDFNDIWGWCGVKTAVLDFLRDRKLSLGILTEDGDFPSFGFQKP